MWGVAASSPALRKSCPHRAQGLPFTQTSGATQHQGAQLLLCDGQAHLWVEGAILCHWLWSGLNLRHLQCEISAKLCDGRCLLERLKTPSLSPEEPRTQAFPHWAHTFPRSAASRRLGQGPELTLFRENAQLRDRPALRLGYRRTNKLKEMTVLRVEPCARVLFSRLTGCDAIV